MMVVPSMVAVAGPERWSVWAKVLAERLSGEAIIRCREPLSRRTTLRVGGPADLYVEPADEGDLAAVARFCGEEGVPWFLLGRGSNLLVRDGGIRGVVVCLASPFFSRVEVEGERLGCGAGARLKAISQEARRHGLGGLEFLDGIPGSLGGALRMNAGAMGSWTFDVVERMRVMDREGRVTERGRQEIEARYRGCPLLMDHVAVAAWIRGVPADRGAIEATLAACNRKRWDSQPAAPSAGCIFKNPKEGPAGRLVDELGLKGLRVGGAVVSPVHANFIVNEGGARARDVLALMEMVRVRVREERGIELEPEVEIIGSDGEECS